ncbi:MAG: hypothetical protein HUU46_01860 [Candidatus Hydrogenedentes bacterium]|nr:hypothetical protein [Candidatus Hydrogenedentota bacterium]
MEQKFNRHEFFQTVARGGFMAGLLGVGAMALHGKREVSECFNHNYCSSCWAFSGCSLPEKKVDAQPKETFHE